MAQSDYAEKILKNSIWWFANQWVLELGLDFDDNSDSETKSVPHQGAFGTLIYSSQISRPDISLSTTLVSRFNNNFPKKHWEVVKRVLRYMYKRYNRLWVSIY